MRRVKLWMIGSIFALVSSFSSSAFALTICDAAQATDNLNVRSSPSTSASILATMPSGSIGGILSGPATQDGYTWWYISWLTGQAGWSVQDFLAFVNVSPLVYTDSIGIGWCLNPWANTTVTAQATPSRVGSYSVKTVTSAAWARLYLRTNGESTVGFHSLRFSIRSESANGQILYVALYNTSGVPFHYVLVSDYVWGGTLSPNTWYDIRIPLAGATELNAANQTIGGFVIESAQPATFYVDDIALDTVSGTTKWPPSSTITGVSASCSPNSIQINQTSQCSATVSGTGSYNSAVTWSANTGSINSSGLFTASSTAATATVTATSVQDSSKSGQANIVVSAPQASQAGSIVYGETIGWGWDVGSWPNVVTNPVSPNAYSGQNGIEVRTTAQYGRIQLLAEPNFKFNNTGYNTLSLNLNIGKYEGEELFVGLIGSNGAVIDYEVLSQYTGSGTLDAYQWQPVRIPLSALGASGMDVYGVEIQSSNPATFYVDEIQFLNTNGGSCND